MTHPDLTEEILAQERRYLVADKKMYLECMGRPLAERTTLEDQRQGLILYYNVYQPIREYWFEVKVAEKGLLWYAEWLDYKVVMKDFGQVHAFVKGNRRVVPRDPFGWVAADKVDGTYRRHRIFKELRAALEHPMFIDT